MSPEFLLTLGVVFILAVFAKPLIRWGIARYDAYKASTTTLVADEGEYRHLLETIAAQQPTHALKQTAARETTIPEKIFQAAISRDLLGRSSQYEPDTSHGSLACAWMVNMVLQKALGDRIGKNPRYVPSVVEALDQGAGHRIERPKTQRGDLAIANGTDYQHGLWHIGICMSDGCRVVLSNSPASRRFDWLSNANFDGMFDQFPGQTTFYHVVK